MLEMGIAVARVDAHGYVYGSIAANVEGQPAIGLIAHMDVIDSVPCMKMKAEIVKDYDGGAYRLQNGETLDPEVMGELRACAGKDLIVTDGNTILGADSEYPANFTVLGRIDQLERDMNKYQRRRYAWRQYIVPPRPVLPAPPPQPRRMGPPPEALPAGGE